MKGDSQEYNVVKGNANDKELEHYKSCFIKNGSPKELDKLKWLHQQNIAGTNMIFYAVDKASGDIAGIYTAIPVLFLINKLTVPAIQSIDTLTDINHRGKGLFIKLAKKLYDDADKNNIALVYGFPNANSAPGFFKKLDWISFGEAPFMIRALSFSYFLKKIFRKNLSSVNLKSNIQFTAPATAGDGKYKIRLIDKFEEDYNLLWSVASEKIKVCVNRDSAYMNWRYADKPGENYYKYGIYHKDQLSGIIVFTLKNKHDGRIGYLMELIYLPDNIIFGYRLLKFATRLLRSQNADVILAWCTKTSFNYKAYRKAHYYYFPKSLRPQKLFFGVKSFDKQTDETVNDLRNWYVSYSDSDTV